MIECDVVIIGAGVIGLAVARSLPKSLSIILVEKNTKFGQETSSRNSEVIHSGIYYPKESNKTKFCIRGRQLLYDYCEEFDVPYSRCGKLLIGHAEDGDYFQKMREHCEELEVPAIEVDADVVLGMEPLIQAERGLYFPESGIVDSHQLMAALERQAIENEVQFAYGHEWIFSEKEDKVWETEVDFDGEKNLIASTWVINCAGLAAAEISNRALEVNRYAHKFCRGRYFTLSSRFQNEFEHLIYPRPAKDGLGVHITIDMDENARIGPDVEWCELDSYENVDSLYDCDWDLIRPSFFKAIQTYCPAVQEGDLTPGLIGIRPKLFVDGNAHPDFLIENKSGFIHCLGIESPGLTASLAIAEEVCKWFVMS